MVNHLASYWLCVTNERNWDIVKKQRLWGVARRDKRQIEKVKPGDALIFYVKPKKIAGIFKVVSESFESNEEIFSSSGFARQERFPYRVGLELVAIPEKPVEFEQLVPRLRFITNKARWALHLWGRAMQTIPEEDYETIWSLMVNRRQKT